MKVGIARPFLGDLEKQAVLEVLESGNLIQGPLVADFERRFAAAHGVRHGVATSNGTTALTLALLAHEIGPGDEVIVPAFSFFATASAVIAVGAVPRFVDIEPDTYTLAADAAAAAVNPRTRAILPVHLYGHPADMERLGALCAAQGLTLLEDAAQAHLAAIGARHVGSWGTAAFSFHPSKNMTTTEGGMVLTDDDRLAERMRQLRNQGRSAPHRHELLGQNFRMTELCAAIGIHQLARLPEWTAQRIRNARHYEARLRRVAPPVTRTPCHHVFHQFTVRATGAVPRDALVEQLQALGVDARVYYPRGIHQQPAIQRHLSALGMNTPSLPVTERACHEVLSLPVHPFLTPSQLDWVIESLNALC